jgi:hypothetical protein
VVIVVEQVVPGAGIAVESIVEDEFEVGVEGVDAGAHLPVELLEEGEVGAPPGLVDGFDGGDGGVVSPGFEDVIDVVDGPLDVVVVDGLETAAIVV